MKKIILVLFLVLTINLFGQDLIISTKNSTTSALGSGATYTGTVDQNIGGYNYLTIIIRADKNSASNGLKIQFGKNSGTYEHNYFFNYTANDTTTNKITLPIAGRYFRVVYTNTSSAQSSFSLTTYLHKQIMLPFTSEGKLNVADATVEATLTNIEADADSTVDMVTAIHGDVDAVEAKLDSIDATASRTEGKVATASNQTNGSQKTQVVDGSGNVIGATSNALDINVKSGSVGIDQTTDGTTNKVQARNATHGDFQVNANLQVGDADVDDTNPVVSKPYLPYVRSVDTWGASADTSEYDFGNNYLKGYVTVYDSSATADTLVFEVYSYAKLGWTTQMIGFRDVVTDYVEIDNATIIIAGTTAKKFEINKLRPGRIRVRPKTPGAVWQTKRVVFEGVN